MKKLLENFKMESSWNSYLCSLYSALKYLNLWNYDESILGGMTGFIFQFIGHEKTCPSSVTVYDWRYEHFLMMDKIGIYSENIFLMKSYKSNTFSKYQEIYINKIKRSIDNNIPILIWAPTNLLEFGIIYGYDDEDKIFLVKDVINNDPDPLLYNNLGLSDVPILYFNIILGKIDIHIDKIIKNSLNSAIYYWNKNHYNSIYGFGKNAYDNYLNSLKNDNYESFGFSYCMSVYNENKKHIVNYLSYIQNNYNKYDLMGILDNYKIVSDNFQKINSLFPFTNNKEASKIPDKEKIIHLLEDSKNYEEKAIEKIKNLF